jgi:hypothetical protein
LKTCEPSARSRGLRQQCWSTSPPWSHGAVGGEAHRTWDVQQLRSMGARCDEGKRERGATRLSPRASTTGGNGGVEPELGVEMGANTVLHGAFYRASEGAEWPGCEGEWCPSVGFNGAAISGGGGNGEG